MWNVREMKREKHPELLKCPGILSLIHTFPEGKCLEGHHGWLVHRINQDEHYHKSLLKQFLFIKKIGQEMTATIQHHQPQFQDLTKLIAQGKKHMIFEVRIFRFLKWWKSEIMESSYYNNNELTPLSCPSQRTESFLNATRCLAGSFPDLSSCHQPGHVARLGSLRT